MKDKITLVRVTETDRDTLKQIKEHNELASITVVIRRLLELHGKKMLK